MTDLRAIADRVEIEALRGELTDAVMMRDYDRVASLVTSDGAVRMPHIGAEATSREEIRAGIQRMQALWEYFVQTTHPGAIELDGDTAAGRAYISELMHGRRGSHHTPGGLGATGSGRPRMSARLPVSDGAWRVDPQRSRIGFAVKEMWGLRTVRCCTPRSRSSALDVKTRVTSQWSCFSRGCP